MKKEIILVNYTGRNGAGPVDAYEMARALVLNGERVAAVLSEDCSNLRLWKELELEELITIPTYRDKKTFFIQSLRFFLFGGRALKCLEKYRIRFIYCPMLCFWTYMINGKVGIHCPVCAVNHDPILHSGEKNKWLMRLFGMEKVYQKASAIVVHSRVFVDYVEEKFHKQGRVLHIPLGRQNVCRKLNHAGKGRYPKGCVNFLFFGRIEPYKGIGILLEAFSHVKRMRDHVSLTIAGAGDCSEWRETMRRLDVRLENRWIEDDEIDRFFYGENLVLVLPYLDATQSGPALIALEYAVPCIAANVGGLKEQVADGKTGLLIGPGDPAALARAMIRLVDHPELRASLSRGAKEAVKKLEWGHLAKKLISFMDDVAQKDMVIS